MIHAGWRGWRARRCVGTDHADVVLLLLVLLVVYWCCCCWSQRAGGERVGVPGRSVCAWATRRQGAVG